MRDLFRRNYTYCTHCPKMCRFACPVSNEERNEAVTPWGKMALAGRLLQKGQAADPSDLDVLSKCTSCGLCRTYCDHGVNVAQALRSARETTLVKAEQLGGYPSVAELTPDGEALRTKLIKTAGPRWRNANATTAYFPGCELVMQDPEHLQDTLGLFSRLGVGDVAVFDGEGGCCGFPLYEAGYTDEFRRLAKRNVLEFNRYKKIVCEQPECVRTLTEVYADFRLPITATVVHLVQFLEPYIRDANMIPQTGTYYYHDACQLGRQLGLTELPRELLRLAVDGPLGELQWSRESSYCCGAGHLYQRTSAESAGRIAQTAVAPLREHPNAQLVTFSARCARHLRANSPEVPVVHGVRILSQALGGEGE